MKQSVKLLSLLTALCLSGCTLMTSPPYNAPSESQVLEVQGGLIDTTLSTTAATVPDATKGSEPTLPEATQPITEPPATQPPVTEPPTTSPPVATPVPIEPEDDDFVRVRDYIPTIHIALAYATQDNFTGQRIYEFSEPWLRYGTVKKLMLVQEDLGEEGFYLKIWDAFRPTAAQFKLWEVYPDPTYVANPINGFSSHSRGNTVDITLVDGDGQEIIMPTGFDDFSKLADRDYSDCSPEAAENALLLERTMKKHGFKPYSGEWWHFSDNDRYPVEKDFLPTVEAWYYADCKEYINLRTAPNSRADAITQIPVNDEFQVLAWHGDFAYVDYNGLRGYVLGFYIKQS